MAARPEITKQLRRLLAAFPAAQTKKGTLLVYVEELEHFVGEGLDPLPVGQRRAVDERAGARAELLDIHAPTVRLAAPAVLLRPPTGRATGRVRRRRLTACSRSLGSERTDDERIRPWPCRP